MQASWARVEFRSRVSEKGCFLLPSKSLVNKLERGQPPFPAEKAIEIDDTLAAAHAELGFITFWYDWDWGASENKLKRALELDPDSADTHLFYAHLLSNAGRHAEALVEDSPVNGLRSWLRGRAAGSAGVGLLAIGYVDEISEQSTRSFNFAVGSGAMSGLLC